MTIGRHAHGCLVAGKSWERRLSVNALGNWMGKAARGASTLTAGWAACSLNDLATQGNPTGRSGLVGNVYASSGATNSFRNGLGQCTDLGLEFGRRRQLALHDTNEHPQLIGAHEGFVFRVVMTGEAPQANPGLTRRRSEREANGVGKRLSSERLTNSGQEGAVGWRLAEVRCVGATGRSWSRSLRQHPTHTGLTPFSIADIGVNGRFPVRQDLGVYANGPVTHC